MQNSINSIIQWYVDPFCFHLSKCSEHIMAIKSESFYFYFNNLNSEVSISSQKTIQY